MPFRLCLPSICLMLAASSMTLAAEGIDFVRDIRPILSENCFKCHGPDGGARETDLRLDLREGLFGAIDDAVVVQPGRSGESLLFQRISSADESTRMPPADSNLSLTPQEIDLIGRWIDSGAGWKDHWSLNPIVRPTPPAVADESWPVNDIDRFVLDRLTREGLSPSPDAERSRLLRRVTLDLTGLPPTPEEIDAFLADDLPGAYERVVERLLASPAFGERLAWDWLDAARYADSNGYQGDMERTMWPWRDWVVEAFNRNLPYDEFTTWQLAGDLLPEATFEQKLATGFCRNHMINGEGGRIPEENRVEYGMDMSETMGTVWLGLTLNCCRCHDHKYDPLTRRDYYSLFAFFDQTPVTGKGRDPQTEPVLEVPSPEQERQTRRLRREVGELDEQLRRRESDLAPLQRAWEDTVRPDRAAVAPAIPLPEELADALLTAPDLRTEKQTKLVAEAYRTADPRYVALREERARVQKELTEVRQAIPKVMVMADQPEPRKSFMLERGLYNKPGEEVTANVPASLPPLPGEAPRNRLGLARWLVSNEQPLTARVTVNRFWQQLFGAGLVRTPEDFGAQGTVPEHAALLDWLAADFRDSGWDVKRLLRQIVTSRTYRQSSRVTPALLARDPENRLLARGPRFRMPAWMLRDQALAASGLLVPRRGGPPVNGYQPPGVWEEATFGNKTYAQDHGESLYRRSLYTFWRRIIAPTMFFDNASRQTCTVKVFRTNTPLHSLFTFNDVTFVEAARALAQRVLLADVNDDAERIDLVYRRVLGRPADAEEKSILLAGLDRSRREYAADLAQAAQLLKVGESPRDQGLGAAEHAAWTALCLAVLNLDEALTKE